MYQFPRPPDTYQGDGEFDTLASPKVLPFGRENKIFDICFAFRSLIRTFAGEADVPACRWCTHAREESPGSAGHPTSETEATCNG